VDRETHVHILDLQCLNVVFLKEVSRSLETICSANDHIEDSHGFWGEGLEEQSPAGKILILLKQPIKKESY
jgi:hypothetical protein